MTSRPVLHGRDRELADWDAAARSLASGTGGTYAVVGRAGMGKTALLRHAAGDATGRGWRVLRAQNTTLNRDLPASVLWQWFAQLVRGTGDGEAPFDGPGDLLRRLVLRRDGETSAPALSYACAWTLQSLVDDGPVVCLVDDAQWADELSLQVLSTLVPLVAHEPVLFVLGLRAGPDEPERAVLADLLAQQRARVHHLAPLKHRDVLAWIGGLPARAEDGPRELASRVQIASAGVPFFVQELLEREAARDETGDETGARSAQAMVLERVRSLPARDREVLLGVALLGAETLDEHLVALTGLDAEDLASAYASLREHRLLTTAYPPRVSHALVEAAALSGLDAAALAGRHRRVARVLDAAGEDVSVVAGHLLLAQPDDDPDVAATLRDAATRALALGSPSLAARLLDRGLDQLGLPPAAESDLLDRAARAHLLCGDAATATRLWTRDLHRLDAEALVRRHLDLGDAQFTGGSAPQAAVAYARAHELVVAEPGLDPDLESRVLARLSGAGLLSGSTGAHHGDRLTQVLAQDPAADRNGDRVLLAGEAIRLVMAGESAQHAGDLAARALRGGQLMEQENDGGSAFAMAVSALGQADRDAETLAHLDAAIDRARRLGAVAQHATLASTRGLVHSQRGRLRLAQADLESSFAAHEAGWSAFADISVSGLVRIRIRAGDLEGAHRWLARVPLDGDRNPMFQGVVLSVHAVHAAARGDLEDGLRLATDAGEIYEAFPGPTYSSWRRDAIRMAAALGRWELARSWAEEELTAARRFGSQRLLGYALRATAAAYGFERAVPLLRESVAVLGRVESRVELAFAYADLAGRLLDPGAEPTAERTAEAAELARRSIALADRFGAGEISLLARRLLERADAGASAPSAPASRVDRLTPSELRVCDLAARGFTNRQIAEHLFVTVKAVEWHLSRSYPKLGITSRRELAAHLDQSADLSDRP